MLSPGIGGQGLCRKENENLKSEIEVVQFGYFTAVEGERRRYVELNILI